MLTCREVTRLVASEQYAVAPLLTRLNMRLHLLMCQHCRRYAVQLKLIGRAARRLADGTPEDAAIVDRVQARAGLVPRHSVLGDARDEDPGGM